MYQFGSSKKRNKIIVWVIVIILVLCMVVPTAYNIFMAIAG